MAVSFQGCGGSAAYGCAGLDEFAVIHLRIANDTSIAGTLDAKFVATEPEGTSKDLGIDIELGEASCFEEVKGGTGNLQVMLNGQSQPIVSEVVGDYGKTLNVTLVLWGTEAQPRSETVVTRKFGTGHITYTAVFASEAAGTYKVFVAEPGEDPLSGKTAQFDPDISKTKRDSGDIDCLAGTQIVYLVDSNSAVVAQSEVCPNTGSSSMIVVFKDDGNGGFTSRYFTDACEGALRILTTSVPSGSVNSPYYTSIGASGGAGFGFEFSIESGSLPNGVTLNSVGELQGVPTQGGTFGFTVKVTDGDGATATQALALTVVDGTASTRARFFNAATDAANASLNGTFNGSSLGAAVAYGQMGSYSDIFALAAVFEARRNGGTLVGSVNANVAGNTSNIFVIAGNQATGVSVAHISKASDFVPGAGNVAFRLVNGLSSVANNVDFHLVPTGDPITGHVPQVVNLAYGAFQLVELPAGNYDLICTPSGFDFEMFRTNAAAVAPLVQVVGVAVSPPGVNGSFLLALDN